MALQFLLEGEETEAELAQVQAVDVVVVDRIGTVVPGFGLVLAELDTVDSFELGGLLMGVERGVVHAEVLGVIVLLFVFVLLAGFLLGILLDYFLVDFADSLVWDPLVIAPVQRLVVDVVLVGGLILFAGGIIIYNMKWKKQKKNLE